MLQEQRKNVRCKVNRVARVYAELGQLPLSCMVTDISESGARLYSDIEMPQQFILSVSGEGVNMQRECRVIWRLGGELGIEFVGRAR